MEMGWARAGVSCLGTAGGFAMKASDRDLVQQWSAEIDRVYARYLQPGQRAALINFPNHANAGDSALWLGERAALRRAGVRLIYQASWASYRSQDLARVLRPDDVILLHGGGNFGDLYLHNQAVVRMEVLREFSRHRTLQLPQSIWFQDEKNRVTLASLCEAHRDFTLLVRDRQSLDLARAHFRVPSELCPDMAFALGPLNRIRPARRDILWLARTDVESCGGHAPVDQADVEVVDWLSPLPDDEPWPLFSRFHAHLNTHFHAVAQQPNRGTAAGRRLLAATFAPMAQAWTRRGCAILSRGRVVVTDRLHGHLLALMMDIPHVVLDNSYGKLRTMYDTWTHASAHAHWAAHPDQALEMARGLVVP